METFDAGSTAAARTIFMSAATLASAKKSLHLSESMMQRLAKCSVTQMSLIALLATELYGWSCEPEGWLMNGTLDYMQTPAGLAEQFQRVLVMAEANTDSRDTVESALWAFCQRICNGPTLVQLSKVTEFPPGSELTMIRFLERLLPLVRNPTNTIESKHATIVFNNITRQLKAMQIASPFLERCNRTFIWTERGKRMAAKDKLQNKSQVEGDVEEWTGKVARKERSEPKSALDDGVLSIFKYKMKDTGLEVFEWLIKLSEDGLVIRRGQAASLEEAADEVYKGFYSAMTKKKLVDASVVQPGTVLVVMGNWITNEQYMAYPKKENLVIVSDASDDTRDDLLFVINWPELGKQKALVTASKVSKARNYGEANADNVVITLKSGFVLDATQDWYVYRAERNLLGEVMCAKCHMVGANYSIMGCLAVRGLGLHCGPCIDFLLEGTIESDALDLSDVILPAPVQVQSEDE